jgi:hypothetical protein
MAGAFQATARAALAGFVLFSGAAHVFAAERAGVDSVRGPRRARGRRGGPRARRARCLCRAPGPRGHGGRRGVSLGPEV